MNTALLSLLQLSDPALPIGGYAHSWGLETYVQEGVVNDTSTAEEYVRQMLSTSLHYTDAALMALSYGATRPADSAPGPHDPVPRPPNSARLMELDALCEAVKLPREIREGSRKLGARLLKIFGGIGAVPTPALTHYPVAFGYCAAMLDIPLQEALAGFYYNAAAGMVTNCVKLIPIGQQDGQQLLFSLHPLIQQLVEKSLRPDPDLIGLCCAGLDIRCMQHEQLYSRLYMS
jgi:urease accessory protein